jgi:3-oxoacyl-[acyl-carrier-protein] synthase-1
MSTVIAGAGVIAAIGNNIGECLSSFEKGQAGMGPVTWLETAHWGKIPVAEVKLDNASLAQRAGVTSPVSRTALLSLIAAQEALHNANIPGLASLRTGFVSANTVGGMDRTEKFFEGVVAGMGKGSATGEQSGIASGLQGGKLRDVFLHECGHTTEWVADRLGIRHYQTTISTACSSSANAIFFGARLIRNGLLDVVVAGGADALTKFTLNGFNSLMILDPDECKPFDENRKGLNLGEGAGYLVLVSDKVAASLGREISCTLSGYCNANDAYHQTASSPDGRGSWLAMSGALQRSGLQPSDIGYINLHGTGTANNDLAEGTAISRLFGPVYPRVSSTKSFTGHTLGASGGIEAVFSVLSIQYGLVYPNLRWQTPMAELPFVPATTFLKNEPIRHVLSNSFGFGGNCTSLIFSKQSRQPMP